MTYNFWGFQIWSKHFLACQEISISYSIAVTWVGKCRSTQDIIIIIIITNGFFLFVFLKRKKLNVVKIFRNKRAKPIIIDPGLYSLNKSEIWWVSKQRSIPSAFKLYTGFTTFPNILLYIIFFFLSLSQIKRWPYVSSSHDSIHTKLQHFIILDIYKKRGIFNLSLLHVNFWTSEEDTHPKIHVTCSFKVFEVE